MIEGCVHYVLAKDVDAVRARIEYHLGVETQVLPGPFRNDPRKMITFSTPSMQVDLDFLRPDVLPPK